MSHRPPPPSRGEYNRPSNHNLYPGRGAPRSDYPSSSRDRDRDRERERERYHHRRSRSPEPRRREERGDGHRHPDSGPSYRDSEKYGPSGGRGGYVPPPRARYGESSSGYVPPPRDDRPRKRDEDEERAGGNRRRGDAADRYAERERDRERDRDRDREGRHSETAQSKRPKQDDGSGEYVTGEEGEAEPGEEVAQQSEMDMMAAMGFGGFGTTKNHKVEGNEAGAANVKKERTWRQYMNRKGGFNRPLDPLKK